MAFGAKTIQIDGDFDRAMKLVESLSEEEDLYLVNSVNPFRIEGQKAIAYELLPRLPKDYPNREQLQLEALALYRARGYVDRDPFGPYVPDPVSVFMEKDLRSDAAET